MPHLEVHPQGLLSNHLWKIDDIFIADFGKRKICTYENWYIFRNIVLMVSAQTGEAIKHMATHCLKCF